MANQMDPLSVHGKLSGDLFNQSPQIACVIGKPGRDIPAEEANDYIAGYLIMNDWSARDTWRNFESKLSMGPAKSKDFATSLGPWLVTPDELEDRREGLSKETRYNLEMRARVNGRELSRGNAGAAAEQLQSALRYEAAGEFWPQYVRGQAYLKLSQPAAAAEVVQLGLVGNVIRIGDERAARTQHRDGVVHHRELRRGEVRRSGGEAGPRLCL